MNENKTITIDLTEFRGKSSTLFTGRPQGVSARKKIKLDKEDTLARNVHFKIPKGTTSFNPSFYLGLLYDSIKKLGIEKFENKYDFIFEDENQKLINILKNNLEDGRRYALNNLNTNPKNILS